MLEIFNKIIESGILITLAIKQDIVDSLHFPSEIKTDAVVCIMGKKNTDKDDSFNKLIVILASFKLKFLYSTATTVFAPKKKITAKRKEETAV